MGFEKEREEVGKVYGPRMQKRIGKRPPRKKFGKYFYIILVSVVVLLAVFFLIKNPGVFSFLKNTYQKLVSRPKEKPKEKIETTFLVVGTAQAGQVQNAQGILVVKFDSSKKQAQAVLVPDNTFVEIPAHNFDQISKSLNSGIQTTVATVANFLEVRFKNYITIDYPAFELIVKERRPAQFFDKASTTNLSQKQKDKISKALAKLKPKQVMIVTVPTRPFTVGVTTYYEPKKDKVKEIVELIWHVKEKKEKRQVRLLVLNGAGTPGVAGDAAKKLISAGYKVIDTKNADNFKYTKTQIEVYKKTGEASAPNIRNILGTGEILRKNVSQDIVDIVIVIGKDYKSS